MGNFYIELDGGVGTSGWIVEATDEADALIQLKKKIMATLGEDIAQKNYTISEHGAHADK